MNAVTVEQVRTIVLLGHTGAGKTTLLDALLHKMGVGDRRGSPADGTSQCDWLEEEKARRLTIWAKPFRGHYTTHAGSMARFNLIDTPGYPDFAGQMLAATTAADAALIVIDAVEGIQVGSLRAWRRCDELNMPRGIVITGLDKDDADFDAILTAIQATWGKRCVPVEIPTKDRHKIIDILEDTIPDELKSSSDPAMQLLEEDAAEEDDQLLEKYLGGEHLTHDELTAGLRVAIKRGHVVPIFEAEPLQGEGIEALLEETARLFPSPLEVAHLDATGETVSPEATAPTVVGVWRTVNDPFSGQQTYVRVYGGRLVPDSELLNTEMQQKERIGSLQVITGKRAEPVTEAIAGDLVAIPKLKHTATGHTLCANVRAIRLPKASYPEPVMGLAIAPKTPGDDDKISGALHRLTDEDPTIHVERHADTKELVISGLGDLHLDVAVARLKTRSQVDVLATPPRVAYRETVQIKGEGHYKHKKQSGGRGQYGEVYLRVEPLAEGEREWFVDAIVGTCIPRNFLPAIEKGLLEAMGHGPLAGFPVVNAKVSVYDGSHHEVDSSEVAFKIAAGRAFSDGVMKARPVLLEPVMHVKISVPEKYLGDINGDLNHRRGRITGISLEDGMQLVEADVPQAELLRYASELRGITHGAGSFEMKLDRYDVVPGNVAQKIIADAAKRMGPKEE